MPKYIAITIGPIFQTMSLSSSPAALWLTSYMFSTLSKTICQQLVRNGLEESDIVTPYYSKDESLLNQNDGVGLFHDRIIFEAENFGIESVNKVKDEAIKIVAEQLCANDVCVQNAIKDVKRNKEIDIDEDTMKNIAKRFGVDYEVLQNYIKLVKYLKDYLMVEAVEFEAKKPITESSQMLDSLELATPFVYREEQNPLLQLFSGNQDAKNQKIKETNIFEEINKGKFQLLKENENIKSLEDIAQSANGNENMKKYKYYAIIRSDGDKMGEIIASLENDESIRDFSKNCLKYCSKVAEAVGNFGGVTIYSGGDDLLAILPCENQNSQTPFNFVKTANDIFYDVFNCYNKGTSLSFGITMAYYKYPLYEALDDSANLLFGVAKQTEKKNCFAIRLQKHAGQAEGLLVPNSSLEQLNAYWEKIKENKATDKVFLSALHKLVLFEKAFNNISNKNENIHLFENIFDGDEHKNNAFINQTLPELFWWLKNESNISAITDNGIKKDDSVLICSYLLRIIKFYFENGGEE